MTDLYPVSLPKITAAAFTPNPVNINSNFQELSVTVTEETVYLEPYYYYSGEIFAGEV